MVRYLGICRDCKMLWVDYVSINKCPYCGSVRINRIDYERK